MTSRLREASRRTPLYAMMLAAALVLLLQTPAFADRLEETAIAVSLRLIAIPVAGAYASGILLAVLFRVFRSRKTLFVSFAFSGISSVPALWLLAADLEFLPRQIRRCDPIDTQIVQFLVVAMGLLFFAWCAPVVQYLWLRSQSDDAEFPAI